MKSDSFEIRLEGDEVVVDTDGFSPELHASADKFIELLSKLIGDRIDVKRKLGQMHARVQRELKQ